MGQIDDGFVSHISELLEPWAPVSARHMFGGWGIYRGALMFALVADDMLYVKRGSQLEAVASGCELVNFSYERTVPAKTKGGKPTRKKHELAYALVPADLLEDAGALVRWAEAAWQDAIAARRAVTAAKPHLPNLRKKPRRHA